MSQSALHFLKYAVASVALALVPLLLASGFGISGTGLILGMMMGALVWVGPVVVLVRALVKWSAGRVLGALCGIPVLLAFEAVHMQFDARQINALDERQFSSAQRAHNVVATKNSYYGDLDYVRACSEICLQILIDGRYTPAVERLQGGWLVFHLAKGRSCTEEPSAMRYFEMLRRGYIDTCIAASQVGPPTDSLIIDENFHSDQSEIRRRYPSIASAYEYLDRINGQDTLLGRWVTGIAEPSLTISYFFGLDRRVIGARFEDHEFYAAALGMPLQKLLPQGNAGVPAVLDAIRPFFDEPQYVNAAMDVFEGLANRSGQDPSNAELLKQFIGARTAELKATLNPIPGQVLWFEKWVERLSAQ